MGTTGKRLDNPMDILGKKSVYIMKWKRPCAVAFLISMQFKEVANLIEHGVFEYTAEDKSNKPSFKQIVTSYKGEDGSYHLGDK